MALIVWEHWNGLKNFFTLAQLLSHSTSPILISPAHPHLSFHRKWPSHSCFSRFFFLLLLSSLLLSLRQLTTPLLCYYGEKKKKWERSFHLFTHISHVMMMVAMMTEKEKHHQHRRTDKKGKPKAFIYEHKYTFSREGVEESSSLFESWDGWMLMRTNKLSEVKHRRNWSEKNG